VIQATNAYMLTIGSKKAGLNRPAKPTPVTRCKFVDTGAIQTGVRRWGMLGRASATALIWTHARFGGAKCRPGVRRFDAGVSLNANPFPL
jgi:hypothetical protein